MNQNSNDILKSIYCKLRKNNYDKAKELFNILCNCKKDEFKEEKLKYINNLIREEERKYFNRNTKKGLNRKKYLNMGNKLLQNDKTELSFYAYTVGYRLTKHPDFIYHMALHYYNEKEYVISKKYFLKYIHCNGTKYIEEAYYYLKELDFIFLPYQERMFDITGKAHYRQKRNMYYVEITNYKRLIKEIKDLKKSIFDINAVKTKDDLGEINLNNKQIKDLISNGKLNDVEKIYNDSDYETKITTLALLYLNNHSSFADKLYKREKDDLTKNCPKLTKKLNANKQLYITKAKFNK